MYLLWHINFLGKVLISVCVAVSASNKQAVYIGGFFASGNGWDIGPVLSSVTLALDHVNDSPVVLQDYELRMVWNNTQCDPTRATWALYQQLYTEPTKLALIGDACSVSTQPIAANAGFWNLNTVSYGAGSPSLSNREEYPYFFRTIISDSLLNSARIHLMREFGWKRVAALHGMEDVFISAVQDLEERLEDANIDVISSEEVTERNVQEVMDFLKDADAKIVTLNMHSATAQLVFCEAYHRGMIGHGYVWMTAGFYGDRWWEHEHISGQPMNCSDEEMKMAVESSYYISTEMQFIGSSETVTIANITTKEYIKQLAESLNQPNDVDFSFHPYGPLAYDALWAIALMLDKASGKMKRSLTEFTYQDKEMAATFFELLSETHFTGVSGEVKFDKNGDRIGRVQIHQLQPGCSEGWHLINSACVQPLNESMSQLFAEQYCHDQEAEYLEECTDSLEHVFEFDDSKLEEKNDREVHCCKQPADFQEQLVAVYTDTTGGSRWEQNGNFTWPGNQIPTDQTAAEIIRVRINVIQPWHYLPFYAFSVLGVLLCFILLVFNNVYRNHWHVKRGSPPMNNLIIVSCLLIYLVVFPASIENSDLPTGYQVVACRARTCILSLGIVLGFGTMVTKTWRVYKIAVFQNATPKQVSIKNKKLYLIISILVGIDILILLVVCSFVRVQEDISTSEELEPHIANKKTVMLFEYCITQHEAFLRVVLWGYHGCLAVLGIFLAWQTRNIPKKFAGLVDNKSIGVCIYMLALVFAVYLFYIVLARPNPVTRFIVKSSIYLYYTTFTLILLFAPMVKSVVNKDPVLRSDPGNCAVGPGANNSVNLDNNQQAQNVNKAESGDPDPHNSRTNQVPEQDNASRCGCTVWCYGMTCRGCSWPKCDVYNVSAVGAASNQNQNEITGSAP